MPGKFGLVGGCATLTGWVLLLILFIMVVFALPMVRNRGGFEVITFSVSKGKFFEFRPLIYDLFLVRQVG